MKIKSLPMEERPREKLIKHGSKSLTNSELLAIILRTGNKKENVIEVSDKIFSKYSIKSLSRVSTSKLMRELGIGTAKSCQIAACFELGRRLISFREKKTHEVKNAKDIVKLFLEEMRALKQEQLKVVYLNSRSRIIKVQTLFIGSLNESIVNPREIFKIALEENAAALILIHNHPSGDPTPSIEDIEITQEIAKGGNILGIKVIDHIIIGDKKYISFKEKNLVL